MPLPTKQQWDLAAAILFAKIEGYVPENESDLDKKKAGRLEPIEKKKDGLTTPEPSPTVS